MVSAKNFQKYQNLDSEALIQLAIERKEGIVAANGALNVTTGKRTGRSPLDRFIVKEETSAANIDWGKINQPLAEDKFNVLWQKASNYIKQRDHFISHFQIGADDSHHIRATVIAEYAWHMLFARNLFLPIDDAHVETEWQVLTVPDLHLDPATDATNSDGIIAINFKQQKVLIVGIAYAGELKKAMFTVLNYLLPAHQVLPMHCAANVGKKGDVALFFGLSGTGKTTLSADPERFLIGDDEHGWNDRGIFNFEGGCYAKCIDLSAEREPVIFAAIRHGAIMENVILDVNKQPNYNDASLTQNTRAAYPRSHIPLRVESNRAGQPNNVIFLTCDMYGVLPPVSVLTKEQAAYHFLSGYTALIGGTEVGQTAVIKDTFSTCFGAPFFPRPAHVYAELLMQHLEKTQAKVYLVNTGWTGGRYGSGKRFPIPVTRAVINAILNGELAMTPLETLAHLNLRIPTQLSGIDKNILDPKKSWSDTQAYDQAAAELIAKFKVNFEKFPNASHSIKQAGLGSHQ